MSKALNDLYTVYDRRTGKKVAHEKTAKECAEVMGVCERTFRNYYAKFWMSGARNWDIRLAKRAPDTTYEIWKNGNLVKSGMTGKECAIAIGRTPQQISAMPYSSEKIGEYKVIRKEYEYAAVPGADDPVAPPPLSRKPNHKLVLYDVTNLKTGEVVAKHESARGCAAAMGIALESFHLYRCRSNTVKMWLIEKVGTSDGE